MRKPKLPCPVCGARDVDIVAAVPAEDFMAHSGAFETRHQNGDRCDHRGRVTLAGAPRYPYPVEGARCPDCRRVVPDLAAHSCYGPQVPQDDDQHRIVIPEGAGVYCWACGVFRQTAWMDPDFVCRTCKAVLLTVGAPE